MRLEFWLKSVWMAGEQRDASAKLDLGLVTSDTILSVTCAKLVTSHLVEEIEHYSQ